MAVVGVTLDAAVRLSLGALELDISLGVGDGEVVALLGPNGAGKTTLLRALAGLVPIETGHVRLDGEVLEDTTTGRYVPPEKRSIGFVFQDYLLFPHLNVLENVAFGLRSRGSARAEAERAALRWLARVELAERARSKPSELSGGERQRVALARALAADPRVLLLDEPLSALDATTRASVRRDLKSHLSSFRGVRLMVTHDPLEAAILADRLVVMENGKHVQTGTPVEVTERPRSRYVADLVGVNLLRGEADHGSVRTPDGMTVAAAGAVSGEVFAVIHPRAVSLYRSRPDGSPRNTWRGRANGVELYGDRARVRIEGRVPIIAEVTPAALADLKLGEGAEVWLSFKATDVGVYPA
ncbi:MAG TPA: ABC transporter ATP-binding protein [Candidatus Dormibacteraeota bacterium]|nr:ABC transporter ATP-binding protein [Candidatus Dormibacteraeota bacterium]